MIDNIISDLGFASGDEVIDSDLVEEVECVIGALRVSSLKSATSDKGTRMSADRKIADYNQKAAESNRRVEAAKRDLKTSVRSALDKANRLKAKAGRLASKRTTARAAQRLLSMADHLTRSGMNLKNLSDKKLPARRLMSSAGTGPKPPAGAPAGTGSNMQPPAGTGLKSPAGAGPKPPAGTGLSMKMPAGAGLKPPVKAGLKPPAGGGLSMKMPVGTRFKKNVLGQILEDLLGEEPYDPYTSERDPKTVAEAQAYVDAAEKEYDSARRDEVAANADLREAMQQGEDAVDEDLQYAFQVALEAGVARGEMGQSVTAGRAMLAALKDQPPPPPTDSPPSGEVTAPPPAPPPPPSSGVATPPPDSAPPPPAEGVSIPDETVPPGTGEPAQEPLYPDETGFVDPFADLPGNVERASRGYGAGFLDEFADWGGDPDYDVEATAGMQGRVNRRRGGGAWDEVFDPSGDPDHYVEAVTESDVLPEEVAFPEIESVPGESGVFDGALSSEVTLPTEGVVGSYLYGTDVLIGSIW